MILKWVIFLSLLGSMYSCKTQEEIRREKQVDGMNDQLQQAQKNAANFSTRFNNLENEITKTTGEIEELNNTQNKDRQRSEKEHKITNERILQLEEQLKKVQGQLIAIQEKEEVQSKNMAEILQSINKLSEVAGPRSTSSSNNNNNNSNEKNLLKMALNKYKDKQIDEASDLFDKILNDKKSKRADKDQALLYLGYIEENDKNWEEAKVYFSRLYVENPKSVQASKALLHLAKSFLRLKLNTDAKETIGELTSKFPNSKEAAEALKLKIK